MKHFPAQKIKAILQGFEEQGGAYLDVIAKPSNAVKPPLVTGHMLEPYDPDIELFIVNLNKNRPEGSIHIYLQDCVFNYADLNRVLGTITTGYDWHMDSTKFWIRDLNSAVFIFVRLHLEGEYKIADDQKSFIYDNQNPLRYDKVSYGRREKTDTSELTFDSLSLVFENLPFPTVPYTYEMSEKLPQRLF